MGARKGDELSTLLTGISVPAEVLTGAEDSDLDCEDVISNSR